MGRQTNPEPYARYRIILNNNPTISVNAAAKQIGVDEKSLRRWILNPPEGWEDAQTRLMAAKVDPPLAMHRAQVQVLEAALSMQSPHSPEYKAFLAEQQKSFPAIAFKLPYQAALDLQKADDLTEELIAASKPDKDGVYHSIPKDQLNLKSRAAEHKMELAQKRMMLYEKYRADGMPSPIVPIMSEFIGIDENTRQGALLQVLIMLADGSYGGGVDFQQLQSLIRPLIQGQVESNEQDGPKDTES